MSAGVDVDVIDEPRRARALLDPERIAILEGLATPASAAALARRLGPSRQRLNYHLRELERHGLIRLVSERRRGSVNERQYQRSGTGYALSGAVLGALETRPEQVQDRFSSAYQIALAARTLRELAALRAGADAARKSLPTFSLDVEVRFKDAAARHAFAEELSQAVAALVAKHHDASAQDGRVFRVHLGSHPKPKAPGGPTAERAP